MGINKVQYGNTTLIDLTSDTVTADKLLQGYTAHDRSGALIIGTATQGGSVTQDQDGFIVLPPDGGGSPSVSGLEYEEDIYEPSADINQPTINFSKTHDTLPILIMMEDISETPQSVDSSNLFFTITNWYSCFNKTPDILATYTYYARQQYAYTNNSGTSFTATGYNINSLNSASSSGMGFWLTTSAFMPRGGTNTYWRAGRTYKWIAVWR